MNYFTIAIATLSCSFSHIVAVDAYNLSLLEDPIFLASYPRSGNTWTRYILEYFTGKGSAMVTLATDGTIEIGGDYPLINQNAGIKIIKSHFFSDIQKSIARHPQYREPTLILLIRSPFEAILRHTHQLNVDRKYFDLIEEFDKSKIKKKRLSIMKILYLNLGRQYLSCSLN